MPLRLDPAFPAKAAPVPQHPPRKEGEAGQEALAWLRMALDAAGRAEQPVLALGDGTDSTAPLWAALPPQVHLLARCAKNRALYGLPSTQPARGRRRLYGERRPRPDAFLAERGGWRLPWPPSPCWPGPGSAGNWRWPIAS